MAYDKIVDSTQLNSDLTDVADAIRTKGGTSSPLSFPTGFVNAIDAIQTGGSATLIEKSITANGTYNASSDSADGYSKVVVSVPASAVDTGTKSITANGNNQDVVGYAAVDVAVPNTYAAGDEGKVVSNGSLVSQTSDTVTQNGTVDTTLINSLTVAVSGGGGLVYEEGTYTAASDSIPTISFSNAHTSAPDIILFCDTSDTLASVGNTITNFLYADIVGLLGASWRSTSAISEAYAYGRLASNLTSTSGYLSYSRSDITSTEFKPYANSTTFLCRTGQTYKWIAIWK